MMMNMILFFRCLACFLLLAGFTTTTTVGLYMSSSCLLQICSPGFSCNSPLPANLTVSGEDVHAINDLLYLLPLVNSITKGSNSFFCDCNDVYSFRRLIGCNCSLDFPNNGTCRVTFIDFSNQNLKGTLTKHIGNLTFLNHLDLSGNFLYGSIPTSVVNLTQLSFLDLCYNNLGGAIPSFNRENKELQNLYLCSNQLNETIPKVLGELPSLLYLYLRYNTLRGTIPPEIWNIKTLLQLELEDNQLEGQLPEQLGNLTNLEMLMLMNNNFSGKLPASIGKLTNLRALLIQGSNFNETIPDSISQLPNIQTLWLIGNNFKGPLPKAFSSKSLLNLAITDVSGDEKGNPFPDVRSLINLTILTLRNCSLTGPIPGEVWHLPKLTALDLSFNKLTGDIPLGLDHKFTSIYLSSNKLNGPLPGWVSLTGAYLDVSENNFTNANETILNGTISVDTNLFACCSGTYDTEKKWLDNSYHCANGKSTYDHLYINCGGNVTVIDGNTYEADLDPNGRSSFVLSNNSAWGYSSMGSFYYSTNNQYIVNQTCNISMADAPLYTGARVAPISLKYYGFCLRNDNYTVKLHFAEIGGDAFTIGYDVEPRRVFNVAIQGKKELEDFNIEEAAGGVYKDITKDFVTSVTDNRLEIHLYWSGKGSMYYPRLYGPLISAISVSAVPKKHKRLSHASIGSIVGSSLVFVALILALFWKFGLLGGKKPNKDGVELYPGGFYKFQELKDATNNFDSESRIGDSGTVYKGKLKDENHEIDIAVKVLSATSKQGALQILQEIGLIFALEHPNIAKPMGCCTKDREVLIVYKYMENISLHYALFGPDDEVKSRLNWQTRLKICLGIAKGLAFLHEESKLDIIHSNIKPTNILLDKDFDVKISDFRYSELHDGKVNEQETPNTPRAKDTGHMAPEYMLGRPLTPQSDVYSFGIVALEIISGQPHIIVKAKGDIYLINTAYKCYAEDRLEALIDGSLRDYKFNEVVSVLLLAMQCVSPSFDLRPTMSEVVQILEGKKKLKRKHIHVLPMVEPITAASPSIGSGMSSEEEGSSRRNISDSQSGEVEGSL